MDERAIKKLAIILIVAIAIIMLFKFMLTRTYSNMNKINAAKKPHPAVVLDISKSSGDAPANAVLPPPAEAMPAETASGAVNAPMNSAQSQ